MPTLHFIARSKRGRWMAASVATKAPLKVAIIHHLGEHQVYTVHLQMARELISHSRRIEIRVESDVTPKEAALKAFDLYAGVSLRKTGDTHFQVMPRTSAALIPAFGSCCGPVLNMTLAAARSDVADQALSTLTRSKRDTRLSRLSTWAFDVKHPLQHPDRRLHADCTHYCLHSDVTWNWVRQLIDCLIRGGCGGQDSAEDRALADSLAPVGPQNCAGVQLQHNHAVISVLQT